MNVLASLHVSVQGLTEEQRRVFGHLAASFGETVGSALLAEGCGLSRTDGEDAVGELVRRSLVEREDDRLSHHLLVRDVGRDLLGPELPRVQNRLLAAARAYAEHHARGPHADPDKLEEELGTLVGAVENGAGHEAWDPVAAIADCLLNRFLALRGHWDLPVRVGRLGILASEKAEGIANALHNLGILAQRRQDFAEAQQRFRESAAIFERLGSPNLEQARRGLASVLPETTTE